MSVSPVRSPSPDWLSTSPAVDSPVDDLVQQQSNSTNEIVAGSWGQALRGILNADAIRENERLPDTITEAHIDGMFSFDANIDQACQRSYAQAIVDLCALPTGRALIKKIIEKCHENAAATPQANPRKMEFINNGEVSQFIAEYKPLADNDRRICSINLKWNGATNSHAWEEWVLLVKKDNPPELDFVNVKVPPAIVLAHELGHFLWAITIKHDTGAALKSLYKKVQKQAKVEYDKIFKDLGINGTRKAEKLFINSWNHANYAEVLNILPLGSIPSAQNPVDLVYSDGIFIGEALAGTWDAPKRPQFTKFNGDDINVNYANSPPGNFVRFSHMSSENFCEEFSALKTSKKTQFKGMVGQLLAKIKGGERRYLKVKFQSFRASSDRCKVVL